MYLYLFIGQMGCIRNSSKFSVSYMYGAGAIPGPLFTKRIDVVPQDLVKSRSRGIRI